jgi:hypothetical protein
VCAVNAELSKCRVVHVSFRILRSDKVIFKVSVTSILYGEAGNVR